MLQKQLIVLIIGVSKKLNKRNVDVTLMSLLIFWYCQEIFCVRWSNQFSQIFTVSNGVRQGGIMSPVLFSIYMDELSCKLNQSHIGCSMNGMIINYLLYADDTCIIAASPTALHVLLDIWADFAVPNLIILNESICVSNQIR